jgi:hypothetical protein
LERKAVCIENSRRESHDAGLKSNREAIHGISSSALLIAFLSSMQNEIRNGNVGKHNKR